MVDISREGSGGAEGSGAAASDPAAARTREHRFGWRAGIALGIAVLIAVYAVAELTAALPPLRDAVEHLPVTIGVLVVGTLAVLAAVLLAPRRS